MWQKMLLIAVAGGFGSVARFGLSALAHEWLGRDYHWGTMAVNVVGCLFFGFIWTLAEEKLWLDAETRIILLVGFMGAFTTFSTFIFETGGYLNDSRWLFAAAHIVFQVISGLLFFYGGVLAARAI